MFEVFPLRDNLANQAEVLRTYLQMTAPDQLRPARSDDTRAQIVRTEHCPVAYYRYLYSEVGRRYHWTDRLALSDAELAAHLAQECVHLWTLLYAGVPAGYFELITDPAGSVELAYFGLTQDFIGLGLGKHLLTVAVEQAWALGAKRVWLHTCSLDDPAALPNYLKRGFQQFKQETYWITP